ncbi:MAG: HIT domain-containing protein [Deltaproteobacteria bacterium]|nr:HIT domain-containing protein [Deltaproteobacteria bacterium]
MFLLHERLKADTVEITSLRLCLVLLMKDKGFPWLILVPQREDIREIHGLDPADRALLMEEIASASKVLEKIFHPDKINVGSLGNIVPQLHIHIIGRFKGDRAWPGPAWGQGPAEPYEEEALVGLPSRIKAEFDRSA